MESSTGRMIRKKRNLLTNEATGDNIYKLSARNASGAILENDIGKNERTVRF